MSYQSNVPNLPPYEIQTLLTDTLGYSGARITCSQALGSDLYVGCSSGELIRFSLQAGDPSQLESYAILSRQTVPGEKAIDNIVLIPSLLCALVQSERQIHFYTLPTLDPHPTKPIRNVVTFAVDDQHLRRPAPSSNPSLGINHVMEPVEICVVKRNGIAMFVMKERLFYTKEIPLPQGANVTLARRTGRYLCYSDRTYYNMVDLEGASMFQLLPLTQAPDDALPPVKPFITVINKNEFLILSWTGASTLGLFITGDGDPIRGTLEWSTHPEGICLDYPYITTLLPNGTVEIHSVETQAIVQVLAGPTVSSPSTSPKPHGRTAAASPPPRASRTTSPIANEKPGSAAQRLAMVASIGGYLVPSTQRSQQMRKVPVKLLRTQ